MQRSTKIFYQRDSLVNEVLLKNARSFNRRKFLEYFTKSLSAGMIINTLGCFHHEDRIPKSSPISSNTSDCGGLESMTIELNFKVA